MNTGIPFSLDALWAIEPSAFEHLRDLVLGSSHEKIAAAAAPSLVVDTPYGVTDGVAVIPFKGVVTKDATIWSRLFGGDAVTSDLIRKLEIAKADPAVDSVLMIVDSPGGTVPGVSDAAEAVASLNAVKPVTAYAQDKMASAAYWIASQAGRIVGNATATVGSIGVFSTIPDVSRMAKNAGVEVNVVKSVSAKGAGTLGAPVTEAQIAEVQRLVDATHALFLDAVSRGRGKNMADVADGRVHIGQAAVDNGLLDAIEPLSVTLGGMKKKPEPTPEPKPMMEEPVMADDVLELKVDATEAKKVIASVAAESAAASAGVAKLRADFDALKASKEIDTLIADADPRKLTPGLIPTARTIAEHGGVDALKAFLASLPTTAPAGGSVQDSTETSEDVGPRHVADHVGGSLAAYDQTNAPAHQKAIAYKEKAEASGRKVSYRDAVVAVSMKK